MDRAEYFRRAEARKVQRAGKRPSATEGKRPGMPLIRLRFDEHSRVGLDHHPRHVWIPGYRDALGVEWDKPATCLSYPHLKRNGYPCGEVEWCVYCWHRRCHHEALRSMIYHAEARQAWRVVIDHEHLWGNPELTNRVRDRVRRFFARRACPTGQAYIHVYGDNPRDGVRHQIDALSSGMEGADGTTEAQLANDLADMVQGRMPTSEGPLGGVRVERWPTGGSGWLDALSNHGKHSGRPTLNTAAIYAGRYGRRGMGPYALSNVGQKDDPNQSYDYLREDGAVTLTGAELIEAQKVHWAARRALPRSLLPRRHVMEEATLEEVLEAAYWRRTWRLEREDLLRARFT